jgi:hypothetical protein
MTKEEELIWGYLHSLQKEFDFVKQELKELKEGKTLM